MKTLGQIAYEAYCGNRGWKSYDDKPLPQWPDVKPEIQKAWQEAAWAVSPALLQAVKDANDLCRSMHEIVQREQKRKKANWKTNWDTFAPHLDRLLGDQHRIMYPEQYQGRNTDER